MLEAEGAFLLFRIENGFITINLFELLRYIVLIKNNK